jgi:hypothetical protein
MADTSNRLFQPMYLILTCLSISSMHKKSIANHTWLGSCDIENFNRYIDIKKKSIISTISNYANVRNTNMFAWLGLRYTRFAVTICPALLNSLSVGALLARYRRTYYDRRGKSFSYNFHHWSGDIMWDIMFNTRNKSGISVHLSEISCSTLEINLVFPRTHVLFSIYYIVESEILRNTQWHIFHIFTSEDIDHVTFSIYTIFCLGLYNKQNITRWLEDRLLSSRVKNNILLTRCARS